MSTEAFFLKVRADDGEIMHVPRGCRVRCVCDNFGKSKFMAIVPNGLPLIFDGRHWILASPIIASLFALACQKTDSAQPHKA